MILSLKMKFGQKFWSWALVKILKLKPLNLIFWFGHSRCPKRKSKTTFFQTKYTPNQWGKWSQKPILATLKWFSHPCTFFFSKSSNGPILKFWILKVLCDMYPKMWNLTLEHFSSLDASSSYMCYECNFSSKSTCNLKQHLLNLKQSHFIPF